MHKPLFFISYSPCSQTVPSTTRNGMTPTYRSRSGMSLHEMKQMDTDHAFSSDFPYSSASQPYHSTIHLSDSVFEQPLPSISPMSYPSQLRNYLSSPERGELPSSPPPQISFNESPGGLQRFPGSSPSLYRPTPLGQQLQKQAERNSTQGSRNSIQRSQGSISALGSRTSFSGSRNSFLSSNNNMSMSGYLLPSGKQMSEEESVSQTSFQPLRKQTSLDMVPTKGSSVSLPPQKNDPMCFSNPLALQGSEEREGREDGDGEDENDLCTDPPGPMTSKPSNQGPDDFPTKEEKQPKVKQNTPKSDDSVLNLQQLTSLGRAEEKATTVTTPDSSGVPGGSEEGFIPKEEKPQPKPMSRLEKMTSLTYIRSSIRRSLKKRVKFLNQSTPDSTPKAQKKIPPRTLAVELTPPDLTFGNQDAIDSVEHDMLQTPSPTSPEFEGGDDYPQKHSDIYPETTSSLRLPFPGGGHGAAGGGAMRMRAYSDMSMFAPQLSQPTYYPSTMHYQPNYPQLSQQYFPPTFYMESQAHRSYGPLQPLQPLPESYTRRYTDAAVGSGAGTSRMAPVGGARGSGAPSHNHKQPSADHHRATLVRSPDMYPDRHMGIDHVLSPDRFTETSNVSDIRLQSPDPYSGLGPGYVEAPLRYGSIPTSPEESPQHYPTRGSGAQHSVKNPQSAMPYTEQSIDSQMMYRQANPLLSPMHYRAGVTDHSTDGRYRRNSIDHQPMMNPSSQPPLPYHIRQSSTDNQLPIAGHIRRTSFDNQLPPNTGNVRRSSVDGQAANASKQTSSNHLGAQHQGYRDYQSRMGYGPHRNGIELDEWQHSQRDDYYAQQYERLELPEWDDNEATPTDPNPGERPKPKIKWNTEIIEYERTPSDCSETFAL